MLLPCTALAQALVNGVQPSAINGIPVTTGFQFDGITLTPPGGGGSAPTVVQSKSTGTLAEFVDLDTPLTAGNVLVAAIYGTPGHTLSFTDSLGSAATMIASSELTTDGDGIAIACAPITAGGSDTLTFTDNGSGANVPAVIYEVHNATCTQDVTAVKSNTLASTSCNSGAITTTTANDLLIAVCGTDATNTATITAGSGWSGGLNAQLDSPTRPLVMSEYQIGTSPGSFTATSGTFTSEEQATLLVALKP
ncbi:MAG TPA: hypothetical protein VHZ28_16185 [Terracidiphilus sp.]|nr:hypothetical protein [Terracidiphilus sp.]